MSNPDIAPKDRLMARVFQAASYAANRSSVLAKITTEPHPRLATYKPMIWFPGHIATSSIKDNWVTFSGDSDAGRLPSLYKRAAVLSFDRQPIDIDVSHRGSRHAVAFALGSTVMVGIASNPNEEIFGTDPDVASNYAVAPRIGKGTCDFTAGVWSDRRGFLMPSRVLLASPSTGLRLKSLSADGIPIV